MGCRDVFHLLMYIPRYLIVLFCLSLDCFPDISHHVCCWYIEKLLAFVWGFTSRYFVEIILDFKHRIISLTNNDHLPSCFMSGFPFLSFSCFIVLKASKTILNRSGENRHPLSHLNFRGNAVSPFSKILTRTFLYMAFIVFKYIIFIPELFSSILFLQLLTILTLTQWHFLSHKKEREAVLPKMFFKTTIILISKLDKDMEQNYRPFSMMNLDVNIFNTILASISLQHFKISYVISVTPDSSC